MRLFRRVILMLLILFVGMLTFSSVFLGSGTSSRWVTICAVNAVVWSKSNMWLSRKSISCCVDCCEMVILGMLSMMFFKVVATVFEYVMLLLRLELWLMLETIMSGLKFWISFSEVSCT